MQCNKINANKSDVNSTINLNMNDTGVSYSYKRFSSRGEFQVAVSTILRSVAKCSCSMFVRYQSVTSSDSNTIFNLIHARR